MLEELIPNEKERIAAIPQLCVASGLRRASRVVSSLYDDLMRSTGLHANQMVLLIVPYLAGPININAMADIAGLDRTTLVRNLKLIERQELISITPGEDDLRKRIVSLTPRGHEALVTAVPLWEEAQRQMIEFLGAQHNDLMSALYHLREMESHS
jgi:DNA-binding MarR family transcriptional regulator